MIKRVLLTATCLLSLSGCSFVLVEGPPQLAAGQRATAPVVCTDNIVLPVLDFLGGGTSMAYAVSAFFLGDVASAIEDESGITETVSDELNLWGFASLAVGGTLVYSGMQGRGKVNNCRRAMAEAASGSSPLFAASARIERGPAFMRKSVWHDVLDQYRSQHRDPPLPTVPRY